MSQDAHIAQNTAEHTAHTITECSHPDYSPNGGKLRTWNVAGTGIQKDHEGFKGEKLMKKKREQENQENQHKRGLEENKGINQSIMAEIKDNQNA